jgi:hypothetical protein
MFIARNGEQVETVTDRRGFLRFGTLGIGGLLLPDCETPLFRFKGAKVIDCWLSGGPSHLDTYDLKPGAPSEVRGPFRSVATNVPGISVCELLPGHQRIADKLVLVRSLCHDQLTHEAAVPCFEVAPSSQLTLPGVYTTLPPGRIRVIDDPAPGGPERRDAFDLSRESVRARDRYGDTCWGRSLLTARRLVEAGAPYVRVVLGAAASDWWDDHFALEYNLRRRLPVFDRAFAALVEDLHDRGLGPEVLVVAWGEFGRAPRIDRFGGRGHWPRAMTAVLSGGGLSGGRVVGATTIDGGEVKDRPVRPAELIAAVRQTVGLATSTGPLDCSDSGPASL